MLFPKRQDVSLVQSGLTLGSSAQFEVTREFHIEAITVQISGTVTTGAATINPDSLAALAKSIVVETSDGVQTRLPVSCSGKSLLEHAVQTTGALDAVTRLALAFTTSTTGAFTMNIPIFFAPRQIMDPVRSFFLLPAPRFVQNPVVRVTLGSQVDIDTNGTPTFAATAGFSVRLIVNRRVVTVPNFPTFDTEYKEDVYTLTAAEQGRQFEIDVPGSYFGVLLSSYQKTTGARGDITLNNTAWSLQALGVIMRRARLDDWQSENDMTVYGDRFAGSYYLDFLTDANGSAVNELSSLLDANIYAATGAKLNLVGDIDGGSLCRLKISKHRVFGNLEMFRSGIRNKK